MTASAGSGFAVLFELLAQRLPAHAQLFLIERGDVTRGGGR